MPRHVIQRHRRELRRSLRGLEREGFRKVHILRSVEEVETAEVVLERRYNDLTHLTGPFDIIGDIHGCRSELETLLGKLGYADGVHPEGRTAVFVGDLVDRGPGQPRRPAPRDVHGRLRQRPVRARQPREQARPLPQGPQGPAHPRTRRDHRAAGQGGRRVPRAGAGVHRRPRQPLRPRRRQARRLPRRTAREVPRPHLGPGPLARAVRRHHRRDRRVRAAGALPVGRGLPGPRRRRLRPHPGAQTPPGSTTPSAWTPARSSAAR